MKGIGVTNMTEDLSGVVEMTVKAKVPSHSPEDEIYTVSMKSIVNTLRKYSLFITILSMVFFVMSIAIAYGYYYRMRPYIGTATALISYGYPGAEMGLDPMGNPLDVSKIKSPYVIDNALQELDLHRLGISVESVRSCLVIGGIIPDNILEQILIIREIATKSPSKLEELPEIQYHPIQYILRLQQRGTLEVLSEQNMVDLLNSIIYQYSLFFIDEYSNFQLLDTIIQNFDQSQYDYHEIVKILEGQVNNMITYCSVINEASSEYRSPTTNMTFGDIISNLELINTVDLKRLGALVFSNNMSRDRQRLGVLYEYNIMRMEMDRVEFLANASEAERLANVFERDYWILNRGNEYEQYAHASDTYDNFMKTAYRERERANALTTQIDYYTRCLDSLLAWDYPSDPRDVSFVEESIPILINTLQEWVSITNQTAEDYLTQELFKDATKVITPAKFRGVFSEYTRRMVLIVIIGTFAGLFLGSFIALWKEAFPVKG